MSFGFNFDGRGGAGKRLNFAADNSTVSNALRIQKAREEREKRERERLIITSAVTIQKWYRGYHSRSLFYSKLQSSFYEGLTLGGNVGGTLTLGGLLLRRKYDERVVEHLSTLLPLVSQQNAPLWVQRKVLDKTLLHITSIPSSHGCWVTQLLKSIPISPEVAAQALQKIMNVTSTGITSSSEVQAHLVLLCGDHPCFVKLVLTTKKGVALITPQNYSQVLQLSQPLDTSSWGYAASLNFLASMIRCYRFGVENADRASSPLFLNIFRKIIATANPSELVSVLSVPGSVHNELLQKKVLDCLLKEIMEADDSTIDNNCEGMHKLISACMISREVMLQSIQFISQISLTPGLIPFLWNCLKKRAEVNSIKMWDTPLAGFFLDVYSYYLESADDDLTFNESYAIRVEDVIAMIPWLRDYITINRIYGANNAAVNVLQRLHIIDERRKFCPKEVWPLPESSTLLMGAMVAAVSYQDFVNEVSARTSSRPALLALRSIPFSIPFRRRVQLFYSFVKEHADGLMSEPNIHHLFNTRTEHIVRRTRLFEDGIKVFKKLSKGDLLSRTRVQFEGPDGEIEAGFGDGVFKEFIVELCKASFSVNHGLFKAQENHGLYPNPASAKVVGPSHVDMYHFLGLLLGKAIYERILVDIPLAKFFRNLILGRANTLSDVALFDQQFYQNLTALRKYSGNVEKDFGINFTVTSSEEEGSIEIPLIPGGKEILVTNENRMKYIHLTAYYRLNHQVRVQTDAFLAGLSEIVPLPALRMFDSNELQMLFQGEDGDHPLDVEDWQANTTYSGGYDESHPTIILFWKYVRNMTPTEQRLLLKFVTSIPRPPLMGFQHLVPQFHIAQFGTDQSRLPSAATCMCLLKLPAYDTMRCLQEKIQVAIKEANTFELS